MDRSIQKNKNWFTDLIKACWGIIDFTRKAFLNVVFIIIAFLIIAMLMANQEVPIEIHNNSILKLNLVGDVVEEKTFVDPYDKFMSEAMGQSQDNPEILLQDIIDVINSAKNDHRIKGILLDLHGLRRVGLNKLQEIGYALENFKSESNKPVIVHGDYFNQTQYYLAAHADEIYLHPMGAVALEGFGRYPMYMKSALEKLKINSHIFRVGTFKSAVEPYIRDDMSEPAKLANKQWLTELWQLYKQDVAKVRELDIENFDESLNDFLPKFKAANGNFAQFAIDNSWVDQLMTHQEFDIYLADKFEKLPKENLVKFDTYIAALQQKNNVTNQEKIGVVVAKGTIYDGKRKAGEIGGHSTASLLRQARKDDNIKAVVLRVDSPGGSAFASEIIRNEVLALKEAGKPVVVSMSSLAASGGYWISASADEIWASPSTITGSIGIFGMFMTFENTLASIGLHTDGVGTTDMAGLSATRALDPQMGSVIQLAIEQGYQQFIGLVAKEREMKLEDVDKIAQGRVWSGLTAHKLGLVDNLGYYQDAIKSAANMAELSHFDVEVVKKQLTPMEQMLQEFFSIMSPILPEHTQVNNGLISKLLEFAQQLDSWTQFNDPMGAYVYCIECEAL